MSDKDADNRAIEYLKSLAADDGDYAFDALESVLDELEQWWELGEQSEMIMLRNDWDIERMGSRTFVVHDAQDRLTSIQEASILKAFAAIKDQTK